MMAKYYCQFVRRALLAVLLPALVSGIARADGLTVDKVYHPYVQPLERELEFRFLSTADSDPTLDDVQRYRLGAGMAFSDRVFGEVYVIGSRDDNSDLRGEAYELELKWQLTEQGEYSADWGLLFEFEVERDTSVKEYGTTLLAEKEFGRWVATGNFSVVYEWGEDIPNEWESKFAGQVRYRYAPAFEPAIELYSGEVNKALGPVALGDVRFEQGRRLHWEFGVVFGLDRDSADRIYRGALEFEF